MRHGRMSLCRAPSLRLLLAFSCLPRISLAGAALAVHSVEWPVPTEAEAVRASFRS